MPKTYTHGDKFAIIDPTGEKKFTRLFTLTGIGADAMLISSQGTALSYRKVQYTDNTLREELLKELMGNYTYLEVGVMPQPYGAMTENTKTKLKSGNWQIQYFYDGKWINKEKNDIDNFTNHLTYRGVQRICKTCGHLVS